MGTAEHSAPSERLKTDSALICCVVGTLFAK